jgi:hypothetical protein
LSFVLFFEENILSFFFYLRLQQTVVPASSSVTKKVIIAVTITFGIMLLIGGVLGGTLSHKGNERKY